MEKNENINNFSETVDNKVPEGAEYDIFSENTRENTVKTVNMNRDYLKHIYNEDMNFLNKDVKMTRMQYLHEIDKLDAYYKAEKRRFYKYFALITVVFLIGLAVGIWFWHEWYVCWKLSQAAFADRAIGNAVFTDEEIKGIRLMAGLYGTLGTFALVPSVTQFFFFGYGYCKKIKHLERYKKMSLNSLEVRKKEAMLLGHYDSIK